LDAAGKRRSSPVGLVLDTHPVGILLQKKAGQEGNPVRSQPLSKRSLPSEPRSLLPEDILRNRNRGVPNILREGFVEHLGNGARVLRIRSTNLNLRDACILCVLSGRFGFYALRPLSRRA